MARILIVEDEEKIARFVTLELEHEGYQVEHAADGRTAVDLALERDYDLILLDVLLPQLNGMEVLRRIRKENERLPVILLTARDTTMDKVSGLDSGADDYVTKPFAIEELLARIRTALRKHAKAAAAPAEENAYTVQDVRLEKDARRVLVNGAEVKLTRKEFDLPLAPKGTAFQQAVWAEMNKIPYGRTRTYGQLAAAIGRPKAARAVGGACHCNPIAIFQPCHRVVGSTGKLTGYAYGVEMKEYLLELEQNT